MRDIKAFQNLAFTFYETVYYNLITIKLYYTNFKYKNPETIFKLKTVSGILFLFQKLFNPFTK